MNAKEHSTTQADSLGGAHSLHNNPSSRFHFFLSLGTSESISIPMAFLPPILSIPCSQPASLPDCAGWVCCARWV